MRRGCMRSDKRTPTPGQQNNYQQPQLCNAASSRFRDRTVTGRCDRVRRWNSTPGGEGTGRRQGAWLYEGANSALFHPVRRLSGQIDKCTASVRITFDWIIARCFPDGQVRRSGDPCELSGRWSTTQGGYAGFCCSSGRVQPVALLMAVNPRVGSGEASEARECIT